MSSSNQFTAFGPAAVGFQTDGTRIDRGAEIAGNTFGVQGTGPIGLIGQGEQDGVRGKGGSGRGGHFESGNLRAQIKLEPQRMTAEDDSQPAQPSELKGPSLPTIGEAGDLWMSEIPGGLETPVALWLCVVSGATMGEPARWCQVLLGKSFAGTQTPF